MAQAGYKQFCPLAMAAEVLCTRWTMVLMRELMAGRLASTIFDGAFRRCLRRFCRNVSKS